MTANNSQSVNFIKSQRLHQAAKDNHQGPLSCYHRRHHCHYSTFVFLLLLTSLIIDIIHYSTPLLTTTKSHHNYLLPIIVEAFVPTTTTTTSFVTASLNQLKRKHHDTLEPSSLLSSSPNIIPPLSTKTTNNLIVSSHHHNSKHDNDDDDTTISLLRTIDDMIQSSSLSNHTTTSTTIQSQILSKIDREHYYDATSHPLVSEKRHHNNDSYCQSLSNDIVPYEIVSLDDGTVILPGNDDNPLKDQPFVIRTTDAILNATSVTHLRNAATSYWNNNHDNNTPINQNDNNNNNNDESSTTSSSTTSRFTYQRVGNSEVHVGDLNHHHYPNAISIVNNALQSKIYPLLRQSLPSLVGERRGRLSVYDALIVRYNASAAGGAAGQPLHRDLGVISVNIALDDVDENGVSRAFRGGGTFFERQMMSQLLENDEEDDEKDARQSSLRQLRPLTPMGIGHAIAHSSSERHAGAATMEGIRHILVIFITERYDDDDDDDGVLGIPPRELAARLKQMAGDISRNSIISDDDDDDERNRQGMMRILHHHLAVMCVPNDGEAWHYLGMALHQHHQQQQQQQQQLSSSTVTATNTALSCLEQAAHFTPCDSRVYNNLGIVLHSMNTNPSQQQQQQQLRCYYHEKAVKLNTLAEQSGCDVGIDANAARLNLGLCYADDNDFERAVGVLSLVGQRGGGMVREEERWREVRIIEDAWRLREWCERKSGLRGGGL